MIKQIIKLIKLLGLSRAIRMKKHHEEGLTYIRGYTACRCWQVLLQSGLLDEIEEKSRVNISTFCKQKHWRRDVLDAVFEYLDGIGLLSIKGEIISLGKSGRVLMSEPRGLFELLLAYDSCFTNLEQLLTGQKRYGQEVQRDITYVGIGSGRLCEQLPYPVMRQMVLEHRCKMVLDLGCGDMAFLKGLCRQDEGLRGHGIDYSAEMIAYDQQDLAKNDFEGRLSIQQGDMFDLPPLPDNLPPVDCITACDTFHEYLPDEDKIAQLLKSLKEKFPGAYFVIGEFCLQDQQWLRKHPTASLEHHLFHQLSNQQIGTAGQWRKIFSRAGLQIRTEHVFDLIGHGYFGLV